MSQLDRSGSISLPVVVGLVAGIAFIVVVVMALKPSETVDDDLRMMIANEYPQFQALKDRYPNVLEQFERVDSMTYIRYVATKEPFNESAGFPGPQGSGFNSDYRP